MSYFWRHRHIIAWVLVSVVNVGSFGLVVQNIKETNRTAVTAAKAARGARDAINTIKAESVKRRHQTCLLFERDHLADVRRVRRTYDYIEKLTADERQSALNRAVLRQLPELEREAKSDRPPPFCDASGVGLKEPNPVVPKRPASLQ